MAESYQSNQEKSSPGVRVKTWIFWKPVVAVTAGALAGFLYYYFVGCSSGSCAITGNPFSSMAFGGLLGYFVVNRPSAC